MKRQRTPARARRSAGSSVGRRGRPRVGLRTQAADAREIDALKAELERLARKAGPPRWNADPDDVRRSVVKLVLTIVEMIRQLLERQAIRRMENGTLTPDETEAVGRALMQLEDTVRELASDFNIPPDELNLDLGPIGRLL